MVDLFWGECGLGLASILDVPIVGYWGMIPAAPGIDLTSASNNPRKEVVTRDRTSSMDLCQ